MKMNGTQTKKSRAFDNTDVPDSVTSCISKASSDRESFMQLCTLAAVGSQKLEVVRQGGLPIIQEVLRAYPFDRRLQYAGCDALRGLSGIDHKALRLGLPTCLDHLLRVLMHHSSDLNLLLSVFQTLSNLCTFRFQCHKAMLDLGGLQIVLRTMRYNKDSSLLQFIGFELLLKFMDYEEWRRKLVGLHTIEVVMAAMMAHPEEPLLQIRGCLVLSGLGKDPETCKRLVELGAVEIFMELMLRYKHELSFQNVCTWAMCPLAHTRSGKKALMALNAPKLLVNVMTTYAEDRDIQQCGCAILWQLARVSANRRVVMASGAKEVVTLVIKRYKADSAITYFAQRALQKMAAHKMFNFSLLLSLLRRRKNEECTAPSISPKSLPRRQSSAWRIFQRSV